MRTIILLSLILLSYVTQAQTTIKSILRSSAQGRIDTSISLIHLDSNNILPISIIKGKHAGPVFSIIAGVHGYEYPPIIAVQQLLSKINPDQLSGSLLLLPVANPAAFFGRVPFVNPTDGNNLNKAFPGNAKGSATARIANFISTEIIANSDFFLDIHGGDASEDLIPFVCYYNNKSHIMQTERAAALCEYSGFENIVSYDYSLKEDQPALYAFKQAAQVGKVALSIEAGRLGTVQEEAVDKIVKAVFNMLEHEHMYKLKTPARTSAHGKNHYSKQTYVASPVKGIFYSSLKAGDKITGGQSIGYISDFSGRVLQEIKAPCSGTILYKVGTPPINLNETLFCIGQE